MNNEKFDLGTIILAIILIVLGIIAVMSFSKNGKVEIESILGGNSSSASSIPTSINSNSVYYNAGSYVAGQDSSGNGPTINMHSVNYSPEVSFIEQSVNNN